MGDEGQNTGVNVKLGQKVLGRAPFVVDDPSEGPEVNPCTDFVEENKTDKAIKAPKVTMEKASAM